MLPESTGALGPEQRETVMPEVEPFVDADRIAEFLVISRRRVLAMARAGDIPAHSIGSGQRKNWRFRLSEIGDALTSQTRQKRGKNETQTRN